MLKDVLFLLLFYDFLKLNLQLPDPCAAAPVRDLCVEAAIRYNDA